MQGCGAQQFLTLPWQGPSARTYYRGNYGGVLPGYSPGGFYGHGAMKSWEERGYDVSPPTPNTRSHRRQRSGCCF
eukprot:Skav211415  [mRNA]  locus=scaffold1608:101690:105106:+ [translate_table: standard]